MRNYFKRATVVMLALAAGMFMLDAQAAKPVKITVTEAVPNEAIQGDALPVRIKGTGFDPGSSVKFIVTDTRDDTQIEVGTVIYDSDTGDLVAHVKVKDQAQVIDYDVEVTTSSGRRGKGTTLFRVRERVGEEDPCLTSTSPFPAFLFTRNLGGPTQTDWYFLLASEDGVCERALYAMPEDPYVGDYEFVYDQAENRGYVTWITHGAYPNPIEDAIWLIEFTVQGNTISSQSAPEQILLMPDQDATEVEASLMDMDISKDLQHLVFTNWKIIPEEWGQVHVLNIEDCRFPNPPCTPGADNLVLESEVSFGWGKVAWGPLAERVYLQEPEGASDVLRRIRMLTNVNGEWVSQVLLSTIDYPEFDGLHGPDAGILGGREKLVFRHEGDCRMNSVVDVANCEAGPTEANPRPCEPESQTFGGNPSWTHRGTVIHRIIEVGRYHKIKGYTCTLSDFIGEWDPLTSEVTPLFEAYDADAR